MIVIIMLFAIFFIYVALEINKFMEFKTRLSLINSSEGETSRITPVSALVRYVSEITNAHHFAEFIYGFTLVRGNPKVFTLRIVQENIVKYVSNRYRDYRMDYTQSDKSTEQKQMQDMEYLKDYVAELYNKYDVPTFIKGKFGIDVTDVECYPEPEAMITGLSYIKNVYYIPFIIDTIIRFGKQIANIAYKLIGFTIEPIDRYGLTYYILDNTKNVSPKKQKFKICIFTHGIGTGLAPYFRFINQMSFYDVIMMIEQPNISFDRSFPHFPPANDLAMSYCDAIIKLTDKYVPVNASGIKDPYLIDIMGQSYGTISMSHIMNSDIYKQMTQNNPMLKFHKKIFIDPVCFSHNITKTMNVIFSDLLSVIKMKSDDYDVIFTEGITFGFGKNCGDLSTNEKISLKEQHINLNCFSGRDQNYNPDYGIDQFVQATLPVSTDNRTQYTFGKYPKYSNLPPVPLSELREKLPIPLRKLWNMFIDFSLTLLQILINLQISGFSFIFNFVAKCVATNNLDVLEAAFRVLFPIEAFNDHLIDDSTYFVVCGKDIFVNSNQTLLELRSMKGDNYMNKNVLYKKQAGHVAPVLNYDQISDMFEKFHLYPYVEELQ